MKSKFQKFKEKKLKANRMAKANRELDCRDCLSAYRYGSSWKRSCENGATFHDFIPCENFFTKD